MAAPSSRYIHAGHHVFWPRPGILWPRPGILVHNTRFILVTVLDFILITYKTRLLLERRQWVSAGHVSPTRGRMEHPSTLYYTASRDFIVIPKQNRFHSQKKSHTHPPKNIFFIPTNCHFHSHMVLFQNTFGNTQWDLSSISEMMLEEEGAIDRN